jgi:hypothetical protein
MDQTSVKTRTRARDISGTIPVAAEGEIYLLLRFVHRGIGGAVNDDIGANRADHLTDLFVIGDIDLGDNGGYNLEFKVCRASA